MGQCMSTDPVHGGGAVRRPPAVEPHRYYENIDDGAVLNQDKDGDAGVDHIGAASRATAEGKSGSQSTWQS